ncbi:hypothetical protein ACFQ4J_12350 [Laceyella tengchongensis]
MYLLLMISCFYWKYVSNRYKLYKSVKWRVGSLLAHIDLSTIFVGIVYWRVSGERWSIGLLQLIMLLVAIGIGHGFRGYIAQELRKPMTGWGKLLSSIGIVGAGNAALLFYFLSRFTTTNVLALVMYSLMLVIVVIIHAMWFYADTPDLMQKKVE